MASEEEKTVEEQHSNNRAFTEEFIGLLEMYSPHRPLMLAQPSQMVSSSLSVPHRLATQVTAHLLKYVRKSLLELLSQEDIEE